MTEDSDEGGRNWFGGGGGAQTEEQRRQNRKRIIALVVGAVMLLFAIVNFGSVKVDWIVGSWHTPLIVVIAISFGLGVAADRLAIERIKRRRRSEG